MKRLVSLAVLVALGALGAPPAMAQPILNLDLHHAPTNFIPGGSPGEPEVETLTNGTATLDEVQAVTIVATGGQFRLSFGGDTTTDLPFNASIGQVQTALRALPSIGSPNVNVSVNGSPPEFDDAFSYQVTFTGILAKTDVAELTVSDGATRLSLAPDLWFDVENLGDTATTGTVTLTVNLPNGLKRLSVRKAEDGDTTTWSCPGAPEDSVITCTTTSAIARHDGSRGLAIALNVSPALEPGSERLVKVKVSGGGSSEAPLAAACPAGAAACDNDLIRIDSEEAGFGILSGTFLPDFFEKDGMTPVRQAGAHPERLVVPFDFNTVPDPASSFVFQRNASENIRNLTVDLPPGFIGNPTAVGECSAAEFIFSDCPPSSQVGIAYVKTNHFIQETNTYTNWRRPVFNMSHPRGAVADLAFVIASNPVHVLASLDPANRYAIRSTVSNINETVPAFHSRVTLWGVPADKSHDSERCKPPLANKVDTDKECSTDLPRKAFLTAPSQCEEDNSFRLHHYDSWQNTGDFGPDITYPLPGKFEGCEKPRFEPKVDIDPTGKQANTPTGLDVSIQVAQNENPDALATPPVKRTVVTLPEGMSFSPSFADGLQTCSLAQIKLFTNDPVACPPASRVGEVELSTPLLPKAAEGSMYLATQGDNPFQSTFALYLVLEDTEERGALIKIPGRIDVDPVTGQITTVFDETPQFPFDALTLKFRSGPRAPLVSPPTCGTHRIGVEISSYAQPNDPIDVSSTYEVTEGPNGTPCPGSASSRPFNPNFNAGTLNPVAGSYSTFLFRLSRQDHEQELSQVSTVLPKGLVAKIAGIPFCPDAAIASISTAEGAGINEQSNPACPAASQIGSLSAGLGAGPGPNYFPGKVYLAGPYKGAPLSLAVIAPAIAGPFDLGNVVVRAALRVNPETAQVTAVSDPFPTILHGVILRVRDVRLRVDRPQTTINPTSCAPMSIGGEISGLSGAIFNTSSPFQVGDCGSLAFKPKLSFRLFGGTKRGGHPKLRAVVKMPAGGANIAKASVALPRSEFLDQSHIGTVCTRVQFKADQCPAASIYGSVSAKTPLLEETLSGPIYLRSSDNPLPDLVAAFRGGRIDADLVGRIDSVNQGIRNTFDFVPDVPVTEAVFSFFGGKKGLLINSRDLCKHLYRATANFEAHSGARLTLRPEMQNSCKKKGRKGKKRRR